MTMGERTGVVMCTTGDEGTADEETHSNLNEDGADAAAAAADDTSKVVAEILINTVVLNLPHSIHKIC